MDQSKEEAQQAYDAAMEKFDDVQAELMVARQALDDHLRQEEAKRAAVYLGYEEGDDEGIRAALAIAERRRAEKEAAKQAADLRDGPIGGVA